MPLRLRGLVQLLGDLFFLHWCWTALAQGLHRTDGFTGQSLDQISPLLAQKSGHACRAAAVLFVKADLAEFGTPLGFPSCSSDATPCFLCDCRHEQLVNLVGWESSSFPHRRRTFPDYEAACARCEMWKTITRRQHTDLRAIVVHDKRKGRGHKGLCLQRDYPDLALLAGDRVEPNETLPDIGQLAAISIFLLASFSGGPV